MTTNTDLQWKKFPVLNDGFVCLVDVMGDDAAIVQAARVSYGKDVRDGDASSKDDKGLIRYLMRHRHTTPFEMCLSGETLIPTFPCYGAKVKTYRLKDIAEAFEVGGKKNSWAKLLRIRTVNPQTRVVTSTKIKKAWKTGEREVYKIRVTFPFSREITVTANHPFLTPSGEFVNIEDLSVGDEVMLNGLPATADDVVAEIRRRRSHAETIQQVSEATGVSAGIVYKYAPGRAKRKTGYLKKKVGQHRDPRAIARRTKELGMCEVPDCVRDAVERHHVDENPHNNSVENLRCLCRKHHKHSHTMTLLEVAVPGKIASIEYVGIEDVYDLEVEDANHTFVADGFVVHNCEVKLLVRVPMDCWRQWIRHRTANVNEYSTRYTEAIDSQQTTKPDEWRLQSGTNKQGSDGMLPVEGISGSHHPVGGLELTDLEGEFHAHASRLYHHRLVAGVAREQARKDLPLSTYTEAYWKCDLHNIFHFLGLRMDSHAQWEIRQYATTIGEQIIKPLFPLCWEAFEDYRLNGMFLTALDQAVIRETHSTMTDDDIEAVAAEIIPNKRERDECLTKLRQLGMM